MPQLTILTMPHYRLTMVTMATTMAPHYTLTKATREGHYYKLIRLTVKAHYYKLTRLTWLYFFTFGFFNSGLYLLHQSLLTSDFAGTFIWVSSLGG